MFGGSTSTAVFGIGGVGPLGATSAVAPVPWPPGAPRGAAVHRSHAGPTAAAWAAARGGPAGRWRLWINASVPIGGGETGLHAMLPQDTAEASVCAWECGGPCRGGHAGPPAPARPFTDAWVAFGAGGGHHELHALVPDAPSIASAASPALLAGCAIVWRSGPVPTRSALGVGRVEWAPAEPGRSLFPALVLSVTSGDYAVYAEECND